MIKVMFVCLGNICRSPTAQGVFSGLVKAKGLDDKIFVDSSGTSNWHIGEPPDPRSVAMALDRGVDLSSLRGSQVSREDFETFDYILAMDKQNLSNLRALAPANYDGHLDLFLSFDASSQIEEVPDPYYGGESGFIQVVDLIEAASEGLLQHIVSHKF